MSQANTRQNIAIGDLVEVLYQPDHRSYGIILGFREFKNPKTRDTIKSMMAKILFEDGIRMQPILWCKLVQKLVV